MWVIVNGNVGVHGFVCAQRKGDLGKQHPTSKQRWD